MGFALGAALAVALAGTAPRADECPDALITAGVKSKLFADQALGAFRINVDTDECIVTLKGCVDARAKIARAKRIAGSVKKVRSVISRLRICPKKAD